MKLKRKTKSIEIWAKLTPQGLTIPNPSNKARIALEAQKMPPEGEDVKLTIAFKYKSKSSELLAFYFGGILALWIAHKKDLIQPSDLRRNPLILRDLAKNKSIRKEEVEDAHEDFMKEFRPDIKMNWITGKTEKGRQRLSDMNGYEASLYITEVCQYVEENSGISLNTDEYKKARDTIELIIQQGTPMAKKYVEEPESECEKPYTAFDD